MQVDHGNYLGMISIRDVVCPLCLQAFAQTMHEIARQRPHTLPLASPAAIAAILTSAPAL